VSRFIRRFRVNYTVLLGLRGTKALFIGVETLPVTVVFFFDMEGEGKERGDSLARRVRGEDQTITSLSAVLRLRCR
jgi:hypothetical protein